jgi:hypothetical protein
MSGRSVASQQPWQIVHSGRKGRCWRGLAVDAKDRSRYGCNPGVTPELEKWSGRLDSNQRCGSPEPDRQPAG